MSEHVLLTGATGLLGRYLVRDLLQAEEHVAVLVRPNRRHTAADRVESMMRAWESRLKTDLPRPHVLSGDISQPGLGLSAEDAAWARAHCDSVLHNAASLEFHESDRTKDPWRSNVDGTKHVLDFCAENEIWDLHHVSTAYICGLRKGRVLESEVDVGQTFSNDYEQSKLTAEKLVRDAGSFNSVTVYRPAIIVGDSKTGFTTTFHGFYHLVRLAWTLASNPEFFAAASDENPNRVPTRITLSGEESKNFVPVDWVSKAMTRIVCAREHHNETYHLTSPDRVSARMMQDVLEKIIGVRNTEFCGAGTELDNPTLVEKLFYEHLQQYDAYWRDDPIFDLTNISNALPEAPCPVIGPDMLLRLAQKAIELNFRWNDPPVPKMKSVATAG